MGYNLLCRMSPFMSLVVIESIGQMTCNFEDPGSPTDCENIIHFCKNEFFSFILKILHHHFCQELLDCSMFWTFISGSPFPNKPWFLRVCSASHLKTLWEKDKLLVTSNLSFSHSIFYWFGKLSAILVKFEFFIFQFGRV